MDTILNNEQQWVEDYRRVETALRYLEGQVAAQPELKEVADHVGLSEYHFQRLFTRWVGISPKRFLQYLTKERAKEMLARSANLLEASYGAGLSGPGRLHDLFVNTEAMTPGEFKRRGAGVEIAYGFHASPFGLCLLAQTGRGVCGLIFVQEDDREAALAELRRRWPAAHLRPAPQATAPAVQAIFAQLKGDRVGPLHLHLSGTNFQIKVWEALLQIPAGTVMSYGDIAVRIGMPGAVRAVGRAVGQNPLPVIIPCHRVIRKMGALGGYRFGTPRKLALLGYENAMLEAALPSA